MMVADPVLIDLARHEAALDEADRARSEDEERAVAFRRRMRVDVHIDCTECGDTIELEDETGPGARHLTAIYPMHTVIYCDRCGEAYELVAVDVDADGGPDGYVDCSTWTWEQMRGEGGGR